MILKAKESDMDKTEELETEKERIGLFGGTFNPFTSVIFEQLKKSKNFFIWIKLFSSPLEFHPIKRKKQLFPRNTV
jgi:hypothetical protein